MGGTGGSATQLAQNILTQLGGATGGYLLAAALTITGILCYCDLISRHKFAATFGLGCLTWMAAWIVNTVIGWAA